MNTAKEMTIITAYYSIDLNHTSKNSYKSQRTKETYLNFFRFWAGLKNNLIVYTDESNKQDIYDIRDSYGLKDKTKVITKSLDSFAPKDLKLIENVFTNYNQSKDRFDPEHPPHTSPYYNYLMYLKSFFIVDAILMGGGG